MDLGAPQRCLRMLHGLFSKVSHVVFDGLFDIAACRSWYSNSFGSLNSGSISMLRKSSASSRQVPFAWRREASPSREAT